MNYIQELNAFYDWTDTNPMPASALGLWHTLMQINNKCMWNAEFTVSIATLVAKTGYQRRSIFLAREELVAKKRLIWKSNGSKQSATYQLIPFMPEIENGCSNEYKSDKEFLKKKPNKCNDKCNEENKKVPIKSTDHCTKQVLINKRKKERKQNSIIEPKGSASSCDDRSAQILEIFNDYNRICKNLPEAKMLTKNRREIIGARLHDVGRDTIVTMLEKAANSKFLAGENNRNWVASFDWVLKPGNFAKILEGKYDHQRNSSHANSNFMGKPSPIELIEEAYNGIMNDEYE